MQIEVITFPQELPPASGNPSVMNPGNRQTGINIANMEEVKEGEHPRLSQQGVISVKSNESMSSFPPREADRLETKTQRYPSICQPVVQVSPIATNYLAADDLPYNSSIKPEAKLNISPSPSVDVSCLSSVQAAESKEVPPFRLFLSYLLV